jgi:hypothetical protein
MIDRMFSDAMLGNITAAMTKKLRIAMPADRASGACSRRATRAAMALHELDGATKLGAIDQPPSGQAFGSLALDAAARQMRDPPPRPPRPPRSTDAI